MSWLGPSLWADCLTAVGWVLRSYQQFFLHSQSPIIGCWNTLGYFQILFCICLGGLRSSLSICLSFNERVWQSWCTEQAKSLGFALEKKKKKKAVQLLHCWVRFVRYRSHSVPTAERSLHSAIQGTLGDAGGNMAIYTVCVYIPHRVPGKQHSVQMSSAGYGTVRTDSHWPCDSVMQDRVREPDVCFVHLRPEQKQLWRLNAAELVRISHPARNEGKRGNGSYPRELQTSSWSWHRASWHYNVPHSLPLLGILCGTCLWGGVWLLKTSRAPVSARHPASAWTQQRASEEVGCSEGGKYCGDTGNSSTERKKNKKQVCIQICCLLIRASGTHQ